MGDGGLEVDVPGSMDVDLQDISDVDTSDVSIDVPDDMSDDMGIDDVPEEFVSGLERRPVNATCVAPPRPAEGSGVRLTRVFAPLSFHTTTVMAQAPGDGSRWYVASRQGTLMVFDAVESPGPARLVGDISDRVGLEHNEKGLLGMAFPPDHATSRQVYLYYTGPGVTDFEAHLSRFVMSADGESMDPGSEQVLLTVIQPFGNHNGGHLAFGRDGHLYLGLGDGGGRYDTRGRAQDTGSLLGSMVRIDVMGQATYAIPPDNPFADGQGGLPEIFAWGFRNPWRYDIDPATGQLWLGDVGWGKWEEIDRVGLGGNYGWPLREGQHCIDSDGNEVPCEPTPNLIGPVAEYAHEGVRKSVTGGVVYRGARIPWLTGRFLYADLYSGPIWALSYDAAGDQYVPEVLIERFPITIASFARDLEGEVYIPVFDGRPGAGVIYRLDPVESASEPGGPAALLSQTGCVVAERPLEASSAMIPYDLNVPFWSDGAEKRRHFALPDGARLSVEEDGHIAFPPGSVLMKDFALGGRRIETRLLIRHDDGVWAGYTYAWREDQSDAELLPDAERREVEGQVWHFPGRGECLACHTSAAGFSLGLEVRQVARSILWPSTGRVADQLWTWAHVGLVEGAVPSEVEALPTPGDGAVSSEAHARAWLHANCAMCHRPGSPVPSTMDLRFETPLGEAGVCDVAPSQHDLGVEGARLLAPGDASRSMLVQRPRALDVDRMPPLGSLVVDEGGAAALEVWIEGLEGCP